MWNVLKETSLATIFIFVTLQIKLWESQMLLRRVYGYICTAAADYIARFELSLLVTRYKNITNFKCISILATAHKLAKWKKKVI